MGDSPTLISMIKCNLEHVVDNVDPKAKFEGLLLPYSPFTQAKKSFLSLMQAQVIIFDPSLTMRTRFSWSG